MKKIFILILLWFLTKSLMAQNEDLDSLLLVAAYKNNTQQISKLLKQGADPNAYLPYSYITPLMYVVDTNNYKATKILLNYGADPNIVPNYGLLTPLQIAISKHYNRIAELLLKSDADPELKNLNDLTAFDFALMTKNYEGFKILLKYSNKNSKNLYYKALLAIDYCDTNAIKILYTFGYKPENDEIIYAFKKECFPIVDLLLDLGADINTRDEKGNSILDYAIYKYEDTALFNVLINLGAEVTNRTFANALAYHKTKNIKYLETISGIKTTDLIYGNFIFTPCYLATSFTDLQYGFSLGFEDPFWHFQLKTGIFTRLGYNSVWLQQRPHFFYQVKEYRIEPYLWLSKNFYLSKIGFSVGIMPYYQMISYNIDWIKNQAKFRIAPTASFFILSKKVNYRFNYFYWQNSNILPKSEHYISSSIEFIIPMLK